jgi:hypothetical protein
MKSTPTTALLLALAAIGNPQLAQADLGIKPTVKFHIVSDNLARDARLLRGELLLCEKDDCADAKPLEEVGPQGFGCSDKSCVDCGESGCQETRSVGCAGRAYGFSPFLQLRLAFSDGRTITSPVFEKAKVDAVFFVHISDAGLDVREF